MDRFEWTLLIMIGTKVELEALLQKNPCRAVESEPFFNTFLLIWMNPKGVL